MRTVITHHNLRTRLRETCRFTAYMRVYVLCGPEKPPVDRAVRLHAAFATIYKPRYCQTTTTTVVLARRKSHDSSLTLFDLHDMSSTIFPQPRRGKPHRRRIRRSCGLLPSHDDWLGSGGSVFTQTIRRVAYTDVQLNSGL